MLVKKRKEESGKGQTSDCNLNRTEKNLTCICAFVQKSGWRRRKID